MTTDEAPTNSTLWVISAQLQTALPELTCCSICRHLRAAFYPTLTLRRLPQAVYALTIFLIPRSQAARALRSDNPNRSCAPCRTPISARLILLSKPSSFQYRSKQTQWFLCQPLSYAG